MATKTFKIKAVLADDGGVLIYDDGDRLLVNSIEGLELMLGQSVHDYVAEEGIMDFNVTITIEKVD